MRTGLSLVILIATSMGAAASGGLSCDSSGNGVTIAIESGVTRGMGGPVFNFRATSSLVSDKVGADLGKLSYTGEHLAQYWLDDKDLRLLLYREREGDKPHGYVEITIRTREADEGSYVGSYELTAFDTTGSDEGRRLGMKGEISCFVE
jgi:hypothetical protein